MKTHHATKKRWYWIYALIVCSVLASPVQADWVDIGSFVTIDRSQPTWTTNDEGVLVTSVTVSITNAVTTTVEGSLRLLITPTTNPDNNFTTPLPIDYDGILGEGGDPGQQTGAFFMVLTAQDGLFEPMESTWVTIRFVGITDGIVPTFVPTLELNDAYTDSALFRKNISKTHDLQSSDARVEVMPLYVDAQDSKGVKLCQGIDGMIPCDTVPEDEKKVVARVKPLIVKYLSEVKDTDFNSVPDWEQVDESGTVIMDGWRKSRDVYAAVSYDDGATWKKTNISRSAKKSSFVLNNGVKYPGDSETPDMIVVGPQVLLTWADKYCPSGNPWDLADADDKYQVLGSQKYVDYLSPKGDDEPRQDLGQRPFSCIWAARGVLNQDPLSPDFGTITWYMGEQISTGRRDAYRNFAAGAKPLFERDPQSGEIVLDVHGNPVPRPGTGGFAVSWQEDPNGLKTGHGMGPGSGMSGASVNHKTDVWYSYIPWLDFSTIDESFVPVAGGEDGVPTPEGDEASYAQYDCPVCGYIYDPITLGVPFVELPDTWQCPVCGTPKADFVKAIRPHVLNRAHPPVRITDNNACKDPFPMDVYGYAHISDITLCNFTYPVVPTTKQPIPWADLPADWKCPKCGLGKETFVVLPVVIKTKYTRAPYCAEFAGNPRVDRSGKYVDPTVTEYADAFYTMPGKWVDVDGTEMGGANAFVTYVDGHAFINGVKVYWTGIPLHGNVGASRSNLSLVNWNQETIALMAYEETKGMGEGDDKVASAQEQKSPLPITVLAKDSMGNITDWKGPFQNTDCVSCHFNHVVPRERVIPIPAYPTVDVARATCTAKGGTWVDTIEAYWPYANYPLPPDGTPPELSTKSVMTSCVKFRETYKICERDSLESGCNYYALPEHIPGWHRATQNCISCHLPYETKDLDQDYALDRYDNCTGTQLVDMNGNGEIDDTNVDGLPDEGLLTNAYADRLLPTYGCTQDQYDDLLVATKDDHAGKIRHGKNIYFHKFPFGDPESFHVNHGVRINLPNSEGKYENARRVRLIPQTRYDPNRPMDQQVTLGLVYKQGIDGQGAPADAFVRFFVGGFDAGNLMSTAFNISGTTILSYADIATPFVDSSGNPTCENTGLPNPEYDIDMHGHFTPKVTAYNWMLGNLDDQSGWKVDANGDGVPELDASGYPVVVDNPYENVFSTSLSIRGDDLVMGFAHTANWAAGKRAKDHYDYYVRSGKILATADSSNPITVNWDSPVNVSRLKNQKITVSDCRIIHPPQSIAPWGFTAEDAVYGLFKDLQQEDFQRTNTFFVAIGTQENIPEPHPNEDEQADAEIFLDVYYTRTTDYGVSFETVQKENPQYDPDAPPYLDANGDPTNDSCAVYASDGITCLAENQVNPATQLYVEVYDWLAQGNSFQGDVQVQSTPDGSKLYGTWQQNLPPFTATDIWLRKITYLEPEVLLLGDLNGDSEVSPADAEILKAEFGTTALDNDFLWSADYHQDNMIDHRDYIKWVRIWKDFVNCKSRHRWMRGF